MNYKLVFIVMTLFVLKFPHEIRSEHAKIGNRVISVPDCTVEYERSTQVGSRFQGVSVLQECLVKLGDRVKSDQILGRIQNRDINAQVQQAKLQADNMFEIQMCENIYAQALMVQKYNDTQFEKRYISLLTYNSYKLKEKHAAIDVEKARFNRSLAQLRYQELIDQLHDFEIRAPHDGVVVEVFKHESERVLGGDTTFLIVDDSQLLVTGQVDVSNAWMIRQGQKAKVTPEIEGVDLPVEREELEGDVIFVDNRLDPQTHTCKVILRVPNQRRLLRSGLKARVEITVPEAVAKLSNAQQF